MNLQALIYFHKITSIIYSFMIQLTMCYLMIKHSVILSKSLLLFVIQWQSENQSS